MFSTRTDLLTGLLMAPDTLSIKRLNMVMTSTGQWTTAVHVNVANAAFPNVSGSAWPGTSAGAARDRAPVLAFALSL